MSTVLETKQSFYVIKCAGDNNGDVVFPDSTGLYTNGPKVSSFVYRNGFYETEHQAREAAERAAREMPGNRYYVVRTVGGYMMPETKIEAF